MKGETVSTVYDARSGMEQNTQRLGIHSLDPLEAIPRCEKAQVSLTCTKPRNRDSLAGMCTNAAASAPNESFPAANTARRATAGHSISRTWERFYDPCEEREELGLENVN